MNLLIYFGLIISQYINTMAMIKEVWFDGNVWSAIKEYAGYSNDYPVELPYYAKILGRSMNYSQTKIKWKRVKTLEGYMDKLWDICWDLELHVADAFAPKPLPKTRDQMRIEWDARNGEGSFDADDGY